MRRTRSMGGGLVPSLLLSLLLLVLCTVVHGFFSPGAQSSLLKSSSGFGGLNILDILANPQGTCEAAIYGALEGTVRSRGHTQAFVAPWAGGEKGPRNQRREALRATKEKDGASSATKPSFLPPMIPKPSPPGKQVQDRRAVGVRQLQVMSDVDDTIKSSGGLRLFGVALGGVDIQYPRGQFYPGGAQFALELSRHNLPTGRAPNRLAVLTARAREFKFALELKPSHKICRKYAATGVEAGVQDWGVGTVLYGSVKEWVCQSRKGLRKYRNFEALRQLKLAQPGGALTDYVFIGDSAEGDLEAGESMVRKYTPEFRGLFMHYVSDVKPLPPMPSDTELLGVPVLYFRTYVGAAAKAFKLGLLDEGGVQAVIDKAASELEASTKSTSDQWDDLLSDIEEAKRVMAEAQRTKDKTPAGTGKGTAAPPAFDLGAMLKRLFPQPPQKEAEKVLKRK